MNNYFLIANIIQFIAIVITFYGFPTMFREARLNDYKYKDVARYIVVSVIALQLISISLLWVRTCLILSLCNESITDKFAIVNASAFLLIGIILVFVYSKKYEE